VIVWTHEQRGDVATHFDMLGIAKEAGRAGSVFDWWDTPVGEGKKVHDVIGVCRSGGDAAACANTIKKFS
jgi:hypothetical protein